MSVITTSNSLSSYQRLLDYQRRDLLGWKAVLKPECYERLEAWTKAMTLPVEKKRKNELVPIMSREFECISCLVPRGEDINGFVRGNLIREFAPAEAWEDGI